MRENRLSGSEGGGTKPIVSSYPYHKAWGEAERNPRFEESKVISPRKRAAERSFRTDDL